MYSHKYLIGLKPKEYIANILLNDFPRFFYVNEAKTDLLSSTQECVSLTCEISHSANTDFLEWNHTCIFDNLSKGKFEDTSNCGIYLTDLTILYRKSLTGLVKPHDLIEKVGCKITVENDSEFSQDNVSVITKAFMKFLAPLDIVVWRDEIWESKHPDYYGARE